jgi:hypothetical protein
MFMSGARETINIEDQVIKQRVFIATCSFFQDVHLLIQDMSGAIQTHFGPPHYRLGVL